MYVLVYSPNGIVGAEGSSVVVTDTHRGAYIEMFLQLKEYLKENGLEVYDYSIDGGYHATAGLYDPNAPEWHIYEV